MTSSHSSQTAFKLHSARRSLALAAVTAAAFSAIGLGVTLRTFAETVLPHILAPGNGFSFQELIDGRPVPRLVDWSYSEIGILLSIRDMGPFAIAIVATFALFGLLLLCIWLINPTFCAISRVQPPTRTSAVAAATPVVSIDSLNDVASQESLELSDVAQNPVDNSESGDADISGPSSIPTAADTNIHIDRIHLEQAARILVIVGLPVAAVWILTGGFGHDPLTLIAHGGSIAAVRNDFLRYVALGVALFAGFSVSGLAGTFGILHQAYQSDDAPVPGRPGVEARGLMRSAFAGAIFGAGMWGLKHLTQPAPQSEVLVQFHMLGTFNRYHFALIARSMFLSTFISCVALGLLFFLSASSSIRLPIRALLNGIVVAAALFLAQIRLPLDDKTFEQRYDATPSVLGAAPTYDPRRPMGIAPAGKAAGLEFAKRVSINTIDSHAAKTQDLVVFHPNGGFQVEMTNVTDDGLLVEPAHVPDVEAYLRKKQYQTALSWVAIKYLFNDANVRFDSTAAIRAGLLDMENTPHMLNLGDTVRNMFSVCSATPENLLLLDEYADEKRFSHDSRGAQRMMGLLYTRFGEVKKATEWYRKADMPRSFMEHLKNEKPLFHAGTVTGKLLWNGKPMAGVQVGAVPQRLNGLPKDLEPQLLAYDRELVSADPDRSPFYSPYHPRPYRLRWIVGGAKTAEDGSFKLNYLTEGQYYLVCTLPSDIRLNVPVDGRLQVKNTPPPFTLSYDSPDQKLGEISFSFAR